MNGLTPGGVGRPAQGLMLDSAAQNVVPLWTDGEAGELTEGPVRLREEVTESHTFCHLITILGPHDIDEGGVEATDVTVEGGLLPRLRLLAGVQEERWCFQRDEDGGTVSTLGLT